MSECVILTVKRPIKDVINCNPRLKIRDEQSLITGHEAWETQPKTCDVTDM